MPMGVAGAAVWRFEGKMGARHLFLWAHARKKEKLDGFGEDALGGDFLQAQCNR